MQGQIIDINTAKLTAKNMQLRASNEEKSKIIIDLQKRIDKSIDKLKHTTHLIGKDKNGVEKEWVYLIDIEKELLEILKGDSNE